MHAQAGLDQPFAEGFALNPIEPAPAGDRFFLVPDGATDAALPEEEDFPLRAMAFGHLTLNPTVRRTAASGETRDIVARQLYVHANLTYVPVPWLLLNADMPFAALQEGEGPAAPGGAIGDLRLGARFGIVGDRNSPFSFGPGVDFWVPTGNADELAGDGHVRVRPNLGVSGKIGFFVYAADVGFQYRKQLYTGSLEVGSALTFGAAAGVSLFDDILQIGPEIQGSFLAISDQDLAFNGRASPVSSVLGARVQLGDVNFGVGYGPGLSDAPGTASRLYASLAFVPSVSVKASAKVSTDRDGDGFQDDEDACPSQAGTIRSGERRGCPETFTEEPAGPVDSDGDDILDGDDACPDKMGSPSDDPAKNGCPDAPQPKAPVDREGDGVPDASDACPSEPGVGTATAETRLGCPVVPKEKVGATVVEPPKPPVVKKPPPVVKKPAAPVGPPVATFVWVRKLSETSVLVFVELTDEVEVDIVQKGRVLEYVLKGTRVTLRNNRNPLLANHFHSVVESAQLVPQGKNVKLVIRLRGEADASARVVRQEQGATLHVEVTTTPAATPATPAAPATPAKP